jgi:hypothetical protein
MDIKCFNKEQRKVSIMLNADALSTDVEMLPYELQKEGLNPWHSFMTTKFNISFNQKAVKLTRELHCFL